MLHPLIVVPDVTWQRKAMMIAAPHKAGAPEAKGLPSINQPIMHPNLSETKQACRKDTVIWFFAVDGVVGVGASVRGEGSRSSLRTGSDQLNATISFTL